MEARELCTLSQNAESIHNVALVNKGEIVVEMTTLDSVATNKSLRSYVTSSMSRVGQKRRFAESNASASAVSVRIVARTPPTSRSTLPASPVPRNAHSVSVADSNELKITFHVEKKLHNGFESFCFKLFNIR